MEPLRLNFFEGMVRNVAEHQMADSELLFAINCNSDKIGEKVGRYGYTSFLDQPDSSEVQSLIYWDNLVTNSKQLYRVSGGNVYKHEIGSSPLSWGSGAVKTGLSTGEVSHAIINGKLFLADGENFCYTTNGNDWTNVTTGTPPLPKYLAVYQGRLQGAGSTRTITGQVSRTGPSTLYWSAVNDGTDWTINLNDPSAAGYKYIDPDNNGKIIGLEKAYNRMRIYKNSASYKWDGGALTDVNKVTTTSNRSIASYKDYSFFLNYDGVWGYPGDTPDIISNPIEDIIKQISGNDFVDAPAIVYNKHYYVSVGDISIDDLELSNVVLDLDWDNSQWFIHTYANKPTAWCEYVDENNNRKFIFGSTNGKTYTNLTGTSDNGEQIDMLVRTKKYDLGGPEIDKKFSTLYIDSSPHEVATIAYQVNNGDWVPVGDLNQDFDKKYINPQKTGSYNQDIRLQYTASYERNRPRLKRMILETDTRGGKK